MIQNSALATQIALSGAARVRQGETPNLKNPKQLEAFQAQQNIDFFEESLKDLQARDNADGPVSLHIFTAGPDTDPATGKVHIGGLEAEYEGDVKSGIRYSTEERGGAEKIKSYHFSEDKIVAYEATVKPDNDVTSNVLILDRQHPENSVMGAAAPNWILGLE